MFFLDRFKFFIFLVFFAIFIAAYSALTVSDDYSAEAEFSVIDEVKYEEVEGFTATIGGVGNSLLSASFEPVVYRDMFLTTESHPNRVIASRNIITYWDTLREGALDGSDVYVYRIENGKFKLVRESYVVPGGAAASGWDLAHSTNNLISKNSNSFNFKWDLYSQPDVNYYFSVKAIFSNGTVSENSNYVSVVKPISVNNKIEVSNNFIEHDLSFNDFSFSEDNQSPQNMSASLDNDGVVSLSWYYDGPTDDLLGYAIYVSDYNPDMHKGFYFELAEFDDTDQQEEILAGDLIIINKKFYDSSRSKNHSNRVWGAESANQIFVPDLIDFFPNESDDVNWELVAHDENIVENAGETYMSVSAFNNGKYRIVGAFNYSGTSQNYYEVLDTTEYTVEAWLRLDGEGKVDFKMGGYYSQNPHRVSHISFYPNNEWAHYSATFDITEIQNEKLTGNMVIDFEGVGVLDIDNVRVYRSDTDFLDLSSTEYEKLKSSGMRGLRTHAFIKTGRTSYNLDQFTNMGGVINGTGRSNTLPQSLSLIKNASMNPWLQIEPHFNPEELRGLVEYLAVPYDPNNDSPEEKPWAYKRYLQGFTEPWVDHFEYIDFEVGNETWNEIFKPWVFQNMRDSVTGQLYSKGEVYGLFNEFVIQELQSSKYWDELNLSENFNFIIGGWARLDYGIDAIKFSPSSNYMTIAAYNGGWDENEGPPDLSLASFFNVLNQTSQVAIPVALKHYNEISSFNSAANRSVQLGTYEAGPGYALNGLNNANVTEQQRIEQEEVMKSVAAGVATLDSFLARANMGFTKQNYFTFSQGATWSSHAKWYNGGQAYPSWTLLEIFNKFTPVSILEVETISVPQVDLLASGPRKKVNDSPLMSLYALKSTDDLVLVAISRMIRAYPDPSHDGFSNMRINIPYAFTGDVTVYYSLSDFDDNNIMAENFTVLDEHYSDLEIPEYVDLKNFSMFEGRGLPPGQFVFFVLEDYFLN